MDHNQSNLYNPKLISPQNSVDLVTGIGELMRLHKEDAAQVLAMETGGRKLPFLRQKGLEQAIESLGAELHSQYMISFSPSDPAPGFHHLEIRVKGIPTMFGHVQVTGLQTACSEDLALLMGLLRVYGLCGAGP